MTPQKDGVVAHIFPSGLIDGRTEIRSTNENFDGKIDSTDTKEITRFHSRYNDKVYVDFNTEQYATLEVFYYKKVVLTKSNKSSFTGNIPSIIGEKDNNDDNPITPNRRGRGHSSSKSKTTTKTVRRSVFTLAGTGPLSDSSMLPEDQEYIISVNGAVGANYDVNITYERAYYVSDDVINCSAGVKVTFNSNKKSDYHAVLEMAYDGPITEPENSKNALDLFCGERYNNGDIIAISIMAAFVLFSIVMFVGMLNAKSKGIDGIKMGHIHNR